MLGCVDVVSRLYGVRNFLMAILIIVIVNIYLAFTRYSVERQISQVSVHPVHE